MDKRVIVIVTIVTLLMLGGALYFLSRPPKLAPSALEDFSKCLTQNGVTMYGAYWCSHCQNQKKSFGDSFRYVNYVECTTDVARCESASVSGYPTWTFADGSRIEGEASLQTLSGKSACALPTPTPTQ